MGKRFVEIVMNIVLVVPVAIIVIITIIYGISQEYPRESK